MLELIIFINELMKNIIDFKAINVNVMKWSVLLLNNDYIKQLFLIYVL